MHINRKSIENAVTLNKKGRKEERKIEKSENHNSRLSNFGNLIINDFQISQSFFLTQNRSHSLHKRF